jgi:hypothetical protein
MRPQAKPQVDRLDLDIDSMVANAREAAEFLKALSHESRLVILCLLVEGEKSVAEARAEVRDVIKALHTAFCPQQRSR